MADKITLPPLLDSHGWIDPAEQRARDLEIVRCVLEAAAQSAELWYANGIETEIAREIRNLEFTHG